MPIEVLLGTKPWRDWCTDIQHNMPLSKVSTAKDFLRHSEESFEEGEMHCLRCKGLMVPMWMGDVLGDGFAQGWRCLLCGEATDPGIEANRKNPPLLVKGRPRLPGSTG